TDGADVLVGFDTDDLIVGSGGDDYMIGGRGRDTYLIGANQGSDVIDHDSYSYVSEEDWIRFDESVSVEDVLVRRSENYLKLMLPDGNSVTVVDWFVRESWGWMTETVIFADGTTWDAETLKAKALAGTSVDDVLIGYVSDDVIDGGAGNDSLDGGGGDDTYVFS